MKAVEVVIEEIASVKKKNFQMVNMGQNVPEWKAALENTIKSI